jgi:hypothetical protein
MHVTYDKKRDWVYEADFNLPFGPNLLDDLRNEAWEGDGTGYNMNAFSYRYRLHSPQSPRLQEVQRWFMGDEFKRSMLDRLYAEEWWSGYWGISPERMWERTTAFGTLTLDKPGFGTGIHLDNRALVAVGMCYFINEDDPEQSTYFYTDKEKSNPLRIPTGWGKGWIAANMHNSWHDGFNHSQKDRYNALLGLVIRF